MLRRSFLAKAILVLVASPIGGAAHAITSVYSYTGGSQFFQVPAGVTSLTVKLWGAGGAQRGGSGAFVSGILSVTPGTSLAIVVGGGGVIATNTFRQGTFGGGGAVYNSPSSTELMGGGGGRSAIRLNGVELVTAGGGGGGSSTSFPSAGGAGGILSGNSGSSAGGGGGTQSAGGVPSESGNFDSAAAGSSLQGGYSHMSGGGSGGGGYFGGGGGGSSRNYGGGGGGSSYIANLSSAITEAGTDGSLAGASVNPGGAGDPNYATRIGVGGGVGTTGGNGRVVLIYSVASASAPEPGTLAVMGLALPILGNVVRRRNRKE